MSNIILFLFVTVPISSSSVTYGNSTDFSTFYSLYILYKFFIVKIFLFIDWSTFMHSFMRNMPFNNIITPLNNE